jgi:hypothetical protein
VQEQAERERRRVAASSGANNTARFGSRGSATAGARLSGNGNAGQQARAGKTPRDSAAAGRCLGSTPERERRRGAASSTRTTPREGAAAIRAGAGASPGPERRCARAQPRSGPAREQAQGPNDAARGRSRDPDRRGSRPSGNDAARFSGRGAGNRGATREAERRGAIPRAWQARARSRRCHVAAAGRAGVSRVLVADYSGGPLCPELAQRMASNW